MAEPPVGYSILDLRVKTLEEELKEVKKELKIQARDNAKGFTDINDRVDILTNFTTEVKIMLSNFSQNQKEMKEASAENQKEIKKTLSETVTELKNDIKDIASLAGKDQGWRALISEIIKVVLTVASIIGGSKLLG
ncbi:hypothetical protein [Peribacillus muralis]|uniref:hypothetical protein n=1 Tax=Peribacillus muralis TaxID=264697 RepID=UPI003CFCA3DC